MGHAVMATRRSPRLMGSVGLVVAVAVAGFAIGLLAFLVARYGPSGGSWSFRGNGALAAYAAVPAVVAAAWTAAAARYRGRARWIAWALAAGLVGLALALLDALLLPVFGPGADQAVGRFVLLALAGWTLAAPALTLALPVRPAARAPGSVGAAAAEALVVVIALGAGLGLATLAFPAGS